MQSYGRRRPGEDRGDGAPATPLMQYEDAESRTMFRTEYSSRKQNGVLLSPNARMRLRAGYKRKVKGNADEDDQKIEVGAMVMSCGVCTMNADSLAKQGSDDGQHNGNDEGNPKTVGYVTPQVAV